MARLHLTPETMEAAYELLRVTLPFRRWKLPPADDVAFHVIEANDRHADHYCWVDRKKPKKGRHGFTIRMTASDHKTLAAVVETLAHEMVHFYENRLGCRLDVEHGATFNRLADSVCRWHGFDRGAF